MEATRRTRTSPAAPGRGMGRARLNYWVDVMALAGAAVVFATGLVLLFVFHVGPTGAINAYGLGLGRHTWVNIHRAAAVVTAAAVLVHTWLHARAIGTRLGRLFQGRQGRASTSDVALYVGFAVTVVAALVAWFIVPGAPPIRGPLALAPLAHDRHLAIDVHLLSGLVAFVASTLHVRRHFGWIVRNGAQLLRRSSRRLASSRA